MKKTILLLAVAALFAMGCATNRAQVLLRYNSADTAVFYVCAPIEGINFLVTDTVRLAGDTTYIHSVESRVVSPYSLVVMGVDGGRVVVNLAIAAGDRVVVDYAGGGFSIDSTSTMYLGQRLYDSLSRAHNIYKYEWVKDFGKAPLDTVGEVMLRNFEALAAADKARVEQLQAQAKIDRKLADFMATAIDYDAALSMSKVMRAALFAVYGTDAPRNASYAEVWAKVVGRYPVTAASLASASGREFAKVSRLYGRLLSDTSYRFPSFTSNTQGLKWQDSVFCAAFAADPAVARPFAAWYLYGEAINNNTQDSTVIQLIETFADDYPGNEFSPYLARFVAENKLYYQKIKAPFSPEVLFVQDTAGLNTLADVFAKFKGRDLFVDFWFSTCSSCIDEFAYAAELGDYLKKNNIDMLYVSIDRENRDENWKNKIKVYDLKGSHIRVNRSTHVDMSENYGINSFPRYMIVDKNGVIVEKSAQEPSSGWELRKQIEKALRGQ